MTSQLGEVRGGSEDSIVAEDGVEAVAQLKVGARGAQFEVTHNVNHSAELPYQSSPQQTCRSCRTPSWPSWRW